MSSKAKRRRLSTSSSGSTSSTSTPGPEEDLSKASTWHSDDDTPPSPPPPSKWKGKGREIEPTRETADEDLEIGYPPSSVEGADSRRVINNLKKWDAKERQRRRVTRDATTNHQRTQSQSVVEDVSRRASLLWNNIGGRSKTKRPSGSDHRVLQDDDVDDEEDEVRLSTLVSSPIESLAEEPTPTQATFDSLQGTHKTNSGNPFDDPDDLSLSRTGNLQNEIAPEDGEFSP